MATAFRHLFLCVNERPPEHFRGSCKGRGSQAVWDELIRLVEEKNLFEVIKVTKSGCLGPCVTGPIMVVYPEGFWYRGLTPDDIDVILEEHILKGRPVKRLQLDFQNEKSDFLGKKIPI